MKNLDFLLKNLDFCLKAQAKQKATESVAYFVLEHQPQKCNELPPNGNVRWTDIEVPVISNVFSAKSIVLGLPWIEFGIF